MLREVYRLSGNYGAADYDRCRQNYNILPELYRILPSQTWAV